MGFDYAGKAIVVTGGASGLGRAFCRELTQRGARVGVADIETEKAEAVAAELEGARAFHVDVADARSIEALAEAAWTAFGRVDGVFNNAGVGGGRELVATKEADADWLLTVNFKGVWQGCRVFGTRFLEQGGPALIVNTGSEHSLGVPHLGSGIYTATKHAVHGMSDVLRRELPDEIQVSLFCPGIVSTDIWNARRNRPETFGGPREAPPERARVMQEGMDAGDVARRALDAVATGAFYIFTHPHNEAMVDARHEEMKAAFHAQTADVDGEGYEVNDIVARLFGQDR